MSGDILDIWEEMKKLTRQPILRLTRMQCYDLTKDGGHVPRVVIGLEFFREHKAAIQNYLTSFKRCKHFPWKWSTADESQNLSLLNCPPVLQRYHQEREQMVEEDGFYNSLFHDSEEEEEEQEEEVEEEEEDITKETDNGTDFDHDEDRQTCYDTDEAPCASSSASFHHKTFLSSDDDEF